MIFRIFFGFFLLLIFVLIESSLIVALPAPLRLLQPTLLMGLLLYHFMRPAVGFFWLLMGGVFLDRLGFSGFSHSISFTLSGLFGIFLAQKFFTNRSFYAMMGLGLVVFAAFLLMETSGQALSRLTSGQNWSLPDYWSWAWQSLFLFAASLLIGYFLIRRVAVWWQRFFLLR